MGWLTSLLSIASSVGQGLVKFFSLKNTDDQISVAEAKDVEAENVADTKLVEDAIKNHDASKLRKQ